MLFIFTYNFSILRYKTLSRSVQNFSKRVDEFVRVIEYLESKKCQTTIIKKKHIDLKSKFLLEKWFKDNINNPYPNKDVKMELSEKTQLDIKKISSWLIAKRMQQKNKKQSNTSDMSNDKRNMLRDFFINISNKPNKLQIKNLSEQLQTSEKKISKWFTYQRFFQKKKI